MFERRDMAIKNPDAFSRFLAAFPERADGHDADAAREAWERATRRAQPETIVAGAQAYALATEGRPARFVMSARRWLNESRWRDAAPGSAPAQPALVWIEYGSAAWTAWAAHWRATRGKSPPVDRQGGWRFPAPTPPQI